jgi:hypothetical protein
MMCMRIVLYRIVSYRDLCIAIRIVSWPSVSLHPYFKVIYVM